MAVGAGLQIMQTLMAEGVTSACGPKGRHNPERTAVRHGREQGSVGPGWAPGAGHRPRMRTPDGAAEVPVPSRELFSQTEVLGRMAMRRMLAGLSTRGYRAGLEPIGQRVENTAGSTSKSAVSRRFVAATETALAELLAAPLHELDLVAPPRDRPALAVQREPGADNQQDLRPSGPANCVSASRTTASVGGVATFRTEATRCCAAGPKPGSGSTGAACSWANTR